MTFQSVLANPIFAFSVRGAQLVFGILAFTLAAFGINKFLSAGSLVWTLICGIITTIYIPVVLLLRRLRPGVLVPGAQFIMETIQAVFYFTAFIAAAAQIGGTNCSFFYSSVFYSFGIDKSACQSSKAAIAFAAFNFVLFTFTAAISGLYVLKPMLELNPAGQMLFQSNEQTGVTFDPAVIVLSTGTSGDEETHVGDATNEPKVEEDEAPSTATPVVHEAAVVPPESPEFIAPTAPMPMEAGLPGAEPKPVV